MEMSEKLNYFERFTTDIKIPDLNTYTPKNGSENHFHQTRNIDL